MRRPWALPVKQANRQRERERERERERGTYIRARACFVDCVINFLGEQKPELRALAFFWTLARDRRADHDSARPMRVIQQRVGRM